MDSDYSTRSTELWFDSRRGQTFTQRTQMFVILCVCLLNAFEREVCCRQSAERARGAAAACAAGGAVARACGGRLAREVRAQLAVLRDRAADAAARLRALPTPDVAGYYTSIIKFKFALFLGSSAIED